MRLSNSPFCMETQLVKKISEKISQTLNPKNLEKKITSPFFWRSPLTSLSLSLSLSPFHATMTEEPFITRELLDTFKRRSLPIMGNMLEDAMNAGCKSEADVFHWMDK